MTRKVKRMISAIVSFALMLTVIATPLGDIVGVTKDSVGTTASADNYQCAIFPMKVVNITQGENGTYSHAGTLAIDIVGADNLFAPFDGTIKKIYAENNSVWLESDNPVIYADGTIDYMTVKFAHDNNISDLYVGKKIKKGENFYQPGTKGNATGSHVHLNCGKGKASQNDYVKKTSGNWTIKNEIHVYDALFLSDSTVIKNGRGYSWINETIDLEKSPSDIGSSFTSTIKCTSTGKFLTVDSNNNVVALSSDNSNKQKWKFTKNSDNYYEIENVATGLRLDVDNAGTTDDTNIQVYKDNDSSAQRWGIYGSQGSYVLKPKYSSSHVLDSDGGNNNVHLWTYYSNLTAQKFTIIPDPAVKFDTYSVTNLTSTDARVKCKAYKPASAKAVRYGICYAPSAKWGILDILSRKYFYSTASTTNVGNTYREVYFDFVSEIKYTLSPNTEYKYYFIAEYDFGDGETRTYTSDTKSFVTKTSSNETHSHSYTSSVTTQPTCTATGVKTYKCSCGSSYTESIAALGHSYSTKVISPICTVQGYTLHTCSRCSTSYKDTYTSATGHSYGSWSTATSATCTSGGTEKRTCSRCGNTETRSTSALGHSYSTKVISPTCTVQGYTLHTCSRCSTSYKDTYTSATGHSYGSWTTTKEATCTEDGEQTRTCSSCGAIETETVKALGHNYATTVVKPTCLAEGYTIHTCSVCGNSYKDNYTDKLVLSEVTGLTIDTTSMSSLTLSWDKNDNATGYFIQQYKNGAWTHVRQLARNTVTTYTATGLAPFTKYQFRIRAYYTDGSSTIYSDYKAVSETTRPSKMAGVVVTSTANSVTINWDINDTATGYLIQQYKDGEWKHIRQLARNTVTSYTATDLTPSTKYQYRIRAYYTDGTSTAYSNYVTLAPTTRPNNLTGIKAASTADTVTLSWDENDSATGYFVQQYKDGKWTHIKQLARNTVLSYTVTGLAPSTKYQFRIRAYYTDGVSTTYSDYVNLVPTTRPNNLTGIKASSTADTVTISWDKNDSATGYFVQQYKNGAWTHVRQLARNTATTYTATGLTPSTKYQYRIRAYYTDGTTTTYSDYKYVSPTTRPTNLTGVKVASTANTVTLSWDKNDTATGYFVQQYKNGTWTHVRQLARNTATTYTATGLTPSTKYQYRIRAYFTDGTTTTYSDYTQTLTVTTKA